MTNEWTIAVDGAAIAALPDKERWGKIVEPAPEYTIDKDATNPEKQKTKLIMNVELSDGRKASYYPNRTSARKIAMILKTDLSKEGMKSWIGNKIIWGNILDMNVAGQLKKVLYVTDVQSDKPKVEKH